MAVMRTFRFLGYLGLLMVLSSAVLFMTPGEAFSLYFTSRASVDSAGNEGTGDSYGSSISADGRYVAFSSDSANLVLGDTNNSRDIFVYDRQTGQTTRVSVDSAGTEGNAGSYEPFISADGRYVAFESLASNLVLGDTNTVGDIFVHDRQTGLTTRVSVDSSGNETNDDSFDPSLSLDGRYVVFGSSASNLVPGDNNNLYDVFVKDLQTGQVARVSVNSSGTESNGNSYQGSAISATGRFVAFASDATNLVAGDFNAKTDIFVHDTVTGVTACASVNSAGVQGDNHSYYPSISADGRYITFQSWSSNLVGGDTNNAWDIIVHDSLTGKTSRISVSSSGSQGNATSSRPTISADGRFVAFSSAASNLVSGDTNGKLDIFVHDRVTRKTVRVNYSPTLQQGDDHSYAPFISAGGPYITFESLATNLVAGDTNIKRDIFLIYPPSVLLSPNGGEFIPSGSTHTITWEAVPVAETFKLQYSLDGGTSWNPIAGASGITGTSFDWVVPGLAKSNTQCLVKLTAFKAGGDRLGTDISDASFTIGAVSLTVPSAPGISVTSGNPLNIEWTTYTKAPVDTVKLFYTLNASAIPVIWNLIETFSGGVNPGIYPWTIPAVSKRKTKCKVKVVLKDGSGKNVGVDIGDNTFTIEPSSP